MSINKKDAEIQAEKIVRRILKDSNQVSILLERLLGKEDSVRYPNAIALENLSKENPRLIYPDRNFFTDLLKSKNAYHRLIAISTISNFSAIDEENKFEEVFEEFFKLTDD